MPAPNTSSPLPPADPAAGQNPIARTSLADAVYETLLEAIVRGQFAPGDEMNAVALAERFQVSRTPVTEALQRLVREGLIDQEMNRRPRVVRLNRADVVEIYGLRRALESAAAELAAERIEEATLSDLRSRLKALTGKQTVDWAQRAIEFDLLFHDALAAAAGNRRLADDIARYRRLVRCFCRLTGNDANLRSAVKEHQEILDAVASRKPQAARKAMAEHIDRRLAAVLAELYPDEE
jgi:DNA-binding GntR family transcriptional regulator